MPGTFIYLAAYAGSLLLTAHSVLAEASGSAYAGSEACRACHESTHAGQVRAWQTSAHHRSILQAPVAAGDSTAMPTFPPHDQGMGNPVDIVRSCIGCHSTGFSLDRRRFVEQGIGCEACHGPGRDHVEREGAPETLADIAALAADRQNMICGQCHSLGTDPSGRYCFPVMEERRPFRPGDDLQAGFIDSRPVGHTRGGEYSTFIRVPGPYADQRCIDCHDPHGSGNPAMLRNATSALCLRCHGNPLTNVIQVDAERHWGSNRQPCWICHEYTHVH